MIDQILLIIMSIFAAAAAIICYLMYKNQTNEYNKNMAIKDYEIEEIRNRLLKSENYLRNVSVELDCSMSEVTNLKNKLDIASRQPNYSTISEYLSDVHENICNNIDYIDSIRVNIADYIVFTCDEYKYRRTNDGQARFQQYHDDLLYINKNFASRCDDLASVIQHIALVREFLVSDKLFYVDGIDLVDSVNKVLNNIEMEPDIDDVWNEANKRRNREFSKLSKMHDILNKLDQRDRERKRVEASLIFEKYSLPPLTPKEKFDRLKSFGSRDSVASACPVGSL